MFCSYLVFCNTVCIFVQNVVIRLEDHKTESQKPAELKKPKRQTNLYTMTDNKFEDGLFPPPLLQECCWISAPDSDVLFGDFSASDGQLCSTEVGTTNQFRTASTARADDDHE